MPRPSFYLISALLMAAAGCHHGPTPDNTEKESVISYSDNGWTNAERAEFYHLAEGSELMPYALIANLQSTKTGKPFLEQMDRFGFLADGKSEWNPRELPVGMTTAKSRNRGMQGITMVGFNCAACHVAEIHYRGKRLRIDGAPSLLNLQGYQLEFRGSLDATLKSPRKLVSLVAAIERTRGQLSTPALEAEDQYAGDPSVKSAGEVGERPTADPGFQGMSSKQADAASEPAVAQSQSFLERLKVNIAILKARLAYLKHGKLIVDGTEPGPGRVDAFGAARNFLFPKFARRMLSPVSFPFIWGVPDNTGKRPAGEETKWIHYDGNTNSILERNIGQALGMGAVFDPKTHESTLRIANIHRLEVLVHKLKAPKWPVDMLGAIDETKAAAGEKIYQERCVTCHQDKLVNQIDVGTDPGRANSFGQLVGPVPFPNAVQPILTGLKNRAFQDDGLSVEQQRTMDADPAVWRATGQYKARPLHGIWATAPYLHNGSVPTLYHLLNPEERPVTFIAGNREFDPVKIGYTITGAGGANEWSFDTTQPGNSNIGHTGDGYGTQLSAADKSALLEYLKKL